MGNTLGKVFKVTTFGESHGIAIGGVIDGCPAGLSINFSAVQEQLDRRKPGQSKVTTSRREGDIVEFLSGFVEGVTTGAPIGFIIRNNNFNSKDYQHIKNVFRPSHADFTYQEKFGLRDYRGGGRSSARETANWVVAGSVAQQLLNTIGVNIVAFVTSVGSVTMSSAYKDLDLSKIDSSIVRCPDFDVASRMIQEIENVKMQGDTIGGRIMVVATGVPVGWGEPVFNKLHAEIGRAMLSINAVHGFKYGFEKVDVSSSRGSEVNDIILDKNGLTKTNYSGGIQGGISNGNDIYCEIDFKPVSSIMQKQSSINADGDLIEFEGKGRHDSCVVPRAVPIVEGMLAVTLADYYLKSFSTKI